MLILGLNSTAFALCSACQLQLSIMQVNYYFILLDFNNTMAEKAALETQIASNIQQSIDWGAEQLQTEDQDARNVLQEMINCIDSETVQLMIQSAALDGTLLGMNSDMQLIQNDINAFPDPCMHENTPPCDPPCDNQECPPQCPPPCDPPQCPPPCDPPQCPPP